MNIDYSFNNKAWMICKISTMWTTKLNNKIFDKIKTALFINNYSKHHQHVNLILSRIMFSILMSFQTLLHVIEVIKQLIVL